MKLNNFEVQSLHKLLDISHRIREQIRALASQDNTWKVGVKGPVHQTGETARFHLATARDLVIDLLNIACDFETSCQEICYSPMRNLDVISIYLENFEITIQKLGNADIATLPWATVISYCLQQAADEADLIYSHSPMSLDGEIA